MRTLARENVFKYLFSKLFNPDDEGLFEVLIKDMQEEDKKFARELLSAVLDNEEKFNTELERLSKSFKFERIHNTDKCALLIGMAELTCFKDTPKIVAIDEAVKLSAKYSAENGTNFVNGILATFSNGD